MSRMRENNYDLLRIVSAVAVIAIHVSATYVGGITNKEIFGEYYADHILTVCIYNVLSRFAVPCFVMLSGAFILADERNENYRFFYRKTFRNVGIPTLVFTCFYFCFNMAKEVLRIRLRGGDATALLAPVKSLLSGAPMYHMWYLYTMVGVYILVPVILRLKKQFGERLFERIAWIFLILACLSSWTSSHKLDWDIGKSLYYTSYFMIGYVLRKKKGAGAVKRNNRKGVVLILAGIGVECLMALLRYRQALERIADIDLEYQLVGPLCPLTVVASVCIFAGASLLTIQRGFGNLSSLTFLIYLFHAGVWAVLVNLPGARTILQYDGRIMLPACIAAVFFISLALSLCYRAVWRRIEKKWAVSDRTCRLVRL